MKRYGNLYKKIIDLDNIREAHKQARKGKRHYREVKMVDSDPDYYLGQIHEMLVNQTYEVGKYEVKHITDRGKEREIHKLPYYPDRIIQWAILLQTAEIFQKSMVDCTCSSIKGRGGRKSSNLVAKYLKNDNAVYCLKFDIKKYYPNVDHKILKTLLRRKFKDKNLLRLFDLIIDSYPEEKGIPIGSYSSQYFGNFYLSPFDHWLKETKKVKYLIRYMDDIVIIHNSKEFLHTLLSEIESFLHEHVGLKVKKNWQIFPINARGIDFVGYRHFKKFKLLRKSISNNYKKRMNEVKEMLDKDCLTEHVWRSAQSYKGWVQNCDSYRLREKYNDPVANGLIEFHKKLKEEVI